MAFKRYIAEPSVKYWHENDSGVYFMIKENNLESKFKKIKIVIRNNVLNELKLKFGDAFEIYIDDEKPFLFMFKKSKEQIKGRVFKLVKYSGGNLGIIRFSYKCLAKNIKHKSAILTINGDGSFIVDCSH